MFFSIFFFFLLEQGLKQGVDRGTSPLNLVCDSEYADVKAIESSASSSEHQIDPNQNRSLLF